jgi:fructose-bisphosphate aldolase class 1
MNADRRAILALIAMGRITPSEAERLLAAWNESRETAWILAASFGFALLAQLHLRELLPAVVHFINMQVAATAESLLALTRVLGGLL